MYQTNANKKISIQQKMSFAEAFTKWGLSESTFRLGDRLFIKWTKEIRLLKKQFGFWYHFYELNFIYLFIYLKLVYK